MSTLNTVNITNGTDSITVEGAVKGSAKAWVNFNGTGTVAIRASYNVSSITDNGVGDYTVNFTSALVDANYCAVATGGHTDFLNWLAQGPVGAPTSSSWRVYGGSTAAKSDLAFMYVAIFR